MDVVSETSDNIDRTVSGLKDGVATATAGLHDAQAAMRDGLQKAIKTTEGLVAFSQGNIEAMTRSGQILMSGLQDIGQTMAASAKTGMEEAMTGFKTFGSVKSFKELFDLQASMMRSAMERSVAQTGQLTESCMKLSERAFAPISARLAVATETLGRIG